MSDYYKEYYQKNREKILFRVKNNYVKRKFNKYEEPKREVKKEEPKKEEKPEPEKIKKNITVTF
jgi:hypothetical protein